MRPDDKFVELGQHRPKPSNAMYKAAATRLCKSVSTALAQRRRLRLGFFSLPGEIRNTIMHLVLVPGEVHIRATKERGVKANIHHLWDTVQRFPARIPERPVTPSLPGFQMLATCKLAYGQYHEMFYSSNTFFLPPGRLEETLRHFVINLQAEHVNMINRIGVTMGLEDLTPAIFKQVQDIMSHNVGYLPPDQVGPAWGIAVQVLLSDIWREKLAFLRHTRGLKAVKLVTEDDVLEIEGSQLRRALEGIGGDGDDFQTCAKEVVTLVGRAKRNVKSMVAERMHRDGWRALRAWG